MKNYSVKFLYQQGMELRTKRFRTEASNLPDVVQMLGTAITLHNYHNPSHEAVLKGFMVVETDYVKDLNIPTLEELALCNGNGL